MSKNLNMKPRFMHRRNDMTKSSRSSLNGVIGPLLAIGIFQCCESFLPQEIPYRTVLSVLSSLFVVGLMSSFQQIRESEDVTGFQRLTRSFSGTLTGESYPSILDLITLGGLGGLSTTSDKQADKNRYKSYPPQKYPLERYQLSTAPVEEDDSENDEKCNRGNDGRGVTSRSDSLKSDDSAASVDSPVGMHYDDEDDDMSFDSRNKSTSGKHHPKTSLVPDADVSSQSTSDEESSPDTTADPSTVPNDKQKKTKKKSKKKTRHMNINPAAAFGVAGESVRRKMDEDEPLHPTLSKEDRRRYLRSLYSHAGLARNSGNDTQPLVPPLVLATNFNIRSSGAWSDEDYFYSRISNPTRSALEQCLAAAEEPLLDKPQVIKLGDKTADDVDTTKCQAACFASGMAAVSAIMGAAAGIMSRQDSTKSLAATTLTTTTTITPKDSSVPKTLVCHEKKQKLVHAVVPKTCYDEVIKMIQLGAGGIASFIRVDMTCLQSVKHALSKHPDRGKILYMETPDNPMTQVCDLQALVKIAHDHNAITIVDTTWSPPLVGQVFRYGIDALCMSCTKTMGGHSDVLCGAVVTNGVTEKGRKLYQSVKDWQISHGGVASPFDCWLVLRGLRSFPVRMERMCSTALSLAQFLENHKLIAWVRYPGLKSHPQHTLAKKQMDLFGQVFTFCIKGSSEAAMAFVGAVTLARRATSTGGTETLVQHQRSIELDKVTPGGVIRCSVGLEDCQDLIQDFSRALECSKRVCSSLGHPIKI